MLHRIKASHFYLSVLRNIDLLSHSLKQYVLKEKSGCLFFVFFYFLKLTFKYWSNYCQNSCSYSIQRRNKSVWLLIQYKLRDKLNGQLLSIRRMGCNLINIFIWIILAAALIERS